MSRTIGEGKGRTYPSVRGRFLMKTAAKPTSMSALNKGNMTDREQLSKEFGLDMPKDEAMERAAKATARDPKSSEPGVRIVGEGEAQITLFKGQQVRQVFHKNEWFFSIVDVVKAVTETEHPSEYWSDLQTELVDAEGFSELSANIVQLKMLGADGRMRDTDSVNVETLFRVIQSIPSEKAEPFKRWLAKTGYERIQEIQNPEIGVKRAILQWQVQGRSEDWIDARIRAIVTRKDLTDEWQARGIVGQEYGQLTNIISRKTFGLDTAAHKKLKGLKAHNLRDHMTDLELIFTMLGEKSTNAIAVATDAQGFRENADAATSGGKVAGDARRDLEKRLGKPITSKDNFLGTASRVNDPKQLTMKQKKPS